MRTALLLLTLAAAGPVAAQGAPGLPGAEAAFSSGEAPALAWSWTPEPRWLDGVAAGRRWFGGGLDYGANFVFTTVPDAEVPPVVLVFDPALKTQARVFDYRRGLQDAGVGRFGGAAYDVSDPDHPRRLNVGFFEDGQLATPDGVWNPDGSATGAHEYLLVFASDYDGTGEMYAGETAYDLDTYYGLAARVRDGHTLYETTAEMTLTPAPLRDVVATAVANGEVEVAWTAAAYVGGTEVRVVEGETVLGTSAPGDGGLRLTGLDPDREYALRVELHGPAGVVATHALEVRPRISRAVAAASGLDPGRAAGSTYGDVWGYTAPDGTEYALLAVRAAGLSIIDVTPAPAGPPVEVAFLASPPGARDAKDVKVYGRHAYVVHEEGPVQIVDLADPRAPVEVGQLDVQPGIGNGGAHNVLVAEGHLWVIGGRTAGNAGLRIYSLADPTAPALVGEYRPEHQPVPYYHDVEVRDGRAYGSAIYQGGGVDVLGVSDPSAVRLLTTFTYPGAGAHNTCTTEDGGTVYVGDEIGSSGNWVRIFDVRDLGDVELVGEVVVDAEATVHNCYVRGDRLYVAHYTEGLRVYDVSDPHAPVEVAFYDTFREPGYGFRGAWTAYPYFASEKIIVSDMQSGLWVVTLEGAAVGMVPAPEESIGLRVWPNPTAGGATLAYDLVAPAQVELAVFDVLGREVARLDADGEAGPHRVALDAGALPAGVYVARLSIGGRVRAAAAVTVTR